METSCSTIHSVDTDLSEKFVVAGCEDSILRLFTIKDLSLELLYELSGHSGTITKVLFINQGELIASSDFNGKLILWKLEGTVFVKKSETQVHSGPIYDISVRYSDKEVTVFCGCDGGLLKTVSFDSSLKTTITEQEIHKYGVISVSCNNEYIVTGGLDCVVCLLTKDGVEHLKHHQGAVNAVALSPGLPNNKDDFMLATCSEDGKLFLIKKSNENVSNQEIDLGEPAYSLDWSRTGFTITVAYGKNKYKSFAVNGEDKFEEVSMEKVEK